MPANLQVNIAMKAKKLLEIIVAQERNKLIDIDFVSEELRNRGRTDEEIDLSIKLACCLSYFSSLFFDRTIPIGFVPGENKHGSLAAYCHPSMPKCNEEGFFIYVKDLPLRIKDNKNYCKTRHYFSINGKIKKYEISKREFLISIGVHEVRHRLQYDKNIKLFKRNKKYHPPIGYLIKFLKDAYRYQKEIYIKEGKSKKFTNWHLSNRELDAELIERIFVDKLQKGINLKELYEIIKMER